MSGPTVKLHTLHLAVDRIGDDYVKKCLAAWYNAMNPAELFVFTVRYFLEAEVRIDKLDKICS